MAPSTSEEDLKKLIGSDFSYPTRYEALNRFNWSEKELFTYEQEIKRIRIISCRRLHETKI
ncbi:hypothetical protein ACRRVD_03250 [Candidatus Cardinium hertigii]|uniref:hypothetical protein n=1 Tax=Candidatus Cardinium hertigii TaxID=247481 RepID=UPI003D7E0B62